VELWVAVFVRGAVSVGARASGSCKREQMFKKANSTVREGIALPLFLEWQVWFLRSAVVRAARASRACTAAHNKVILENLFSEWLVFENLEDTYRRWTSAEERKWYEALEVGHVNRQLRLKITPP
jgi:hypothetical protein